MQGVRVFSAALSQRQCMYSSELGSLTLRRTGLAGRSTSAQRSLRSHSQLYVVPSSLWDVYRKREGGAAVREKSTSRHTQTAVSYHLFSFRSSYTRKRTSRMCERVLTKKYYNGAKGNGARNPDTRQEGRTQTVKYNNISRKTPEVNESARQVESHRVRRVSPPCQYGPRQPCRGRIRELGRHLLLESYPTLSSPDCALRRRGRTRELRRQTYFWTCVNPSLSSPDCTFRDAD